MKKISRIVFFFFPSSKMWKKKKRPKKFFKKINVFYFNFNWVSRIWTSCWALARSFSNSINFVWSLVSLDRYRAQFSSCNPLKSGKGYKNACVNDGFLIDNWGKYNFRSVFIALARFNLSLVFSKYSFNYSASIRLCQIYFYEKEKK